MTETKEEVIAALGSLDKFNAFMQARIGKAGLKEWVINGQLVLPSDRCGVLTAELTLDYDKIVMGTLKPVVAYTDLVEVYGNHIGWSGPASFPIPKHTDVCPECGNGWTIGNMTNSVEIRGNDDVNRIYHKRCYEIHARREERKLFTALLEEAGIKDPVMSEIPNGYWSLTGTWKYGCIPWFLVSLPAGDIKIGCRKRVISIDWSGIDLFKDLDLSKGLFASEDVTKSSTGIHAWGREKAVEYLAKIQEQL